MVARGPRRLFPGRGSTAILAGCQPSPADDVMKRGATRAYLLADEDPDLGIKFSQNTVAVCERIFKWRLLVTCFKERGIRGLYLKLRRLLINEKPSFASIGYSHQQLSRVPRGTANHQSQFHCPKSKISKVWFELEEDKQ